VGKDILNSTNTRKMRKVNGLLENTGTKPSSVFSMEDLVKEVSPSITSKCILLD